MDLETARQVAILAYDDGIIDVDNLARLLTAVGQNSHEAAEIPGLFLRTLDIDHHELGEMIDRVNQRIATRHLRAKARETMESSNIALRAAYSTDELQEIGKARSDETIRHKRYAVGRELGRGGVGRVVLGWDRYLHRSVAMKVAIPSVENAVENLAIEAKTTGGLEHPNIVPVYDFGVLEDGSLFYAMKYVRRHSLYEILRGVRMGDQDMAKEYSLVRLLGIFQQVRMALHYAHVKGVVHRDIKPDNIMVGEYGEVLVMDWGLAVVYMGANASKTMKLRAARPMDQRRLVGTPEYMPPEQARGDPDKIAPAIDVYALGAVLYEILSLKPPYTGKTAADVVYKVLHNPLVSPSERAPERDIPVELETICLRALSEKPEDRYPSARDLRNAVEEYLDGRRRRVERVSEAEESLERANRELDELRFFEEKIAAMQYELDRLQAAIEPDARVDERRRIWDIEDQLRDLIMGRMDAFERAEAALQRAQALLPDNHETRVRLAHLYLDQSMSPIWDRDSVISHYYRRLVNRYDPQGVGAQLTNEGRLILRGTFEHATVMRLSEQSRRLRAVGDARPLSAETARSLMPGRYEVQVRVGAGLDVTTTCLIERDETTVVELGDLRPAPNGDLLMVPGGPVLLGGDREAYRALPGRPEMIDAFYAMQYPVTFGEYSQFLSALYKEDPDLALKHVPRTPSGGMLCDLLPGEGYRPGMRIMASAPRDEYPPDSGIEWMVPLFGISFVDAQVYIQWRSRVEGIAYRMLAEVEFEKMARGGDGRLYPWGDRYDTSFSLTEMTHRQGAWPEPVGVFHTDMGPYGHRDLSGGVQTWTADVIDGKAVVKGGAWCLGPALRAASRRLIALDARLPEIGLRLALDLR